MEQSDILCADCEEVILQMRKVKDTEDVFNLTVSCPFCEGESWSTELKGKHYQQTVDGTRVEEFIQVDEKSFLIKFVKHD